ncbi:MAG: hypothetical protein WKG01_38490 [Kofleriaceae bacterium]
MRRLALVLVLIVLGSVAGSDAGAQPAAQGAARREAIKKKIRALRAYTLTDELQLDDKTTARLFPVLARWDDVTEKLVQQRVDLMRRLHTADQLKDPRAVDRLLDEAIANQKAFWDLEDKRVAELRKVLTPAQTARLLIVLPAFERRIQNQLRRAISRRGAGADVDVDADDDDLDGRQRPRLRSRR